MRRFVTRHPWRVIRRRRARDNRATRPRRRGRVRGVAISYASLFGRPRDGDIAPFKSGVEHILQRASDAGRPVPVVPMALKGMWESMWSQNDSRLGRMRVPRRFRAHVEVVAGPPLDGREANAAALEERVRALRGDAA